MRPDLVWQGSLFAGGEPEVDVSFAGLRRLLLDERSWVDHVPGWLAGSDELFAELASSGRWRQREVTMYERLVREPRLTAGWAVDDANEPVRSWTRHPRTPAAEAQRPAATEDGRADVAAESIPAALRQIAAALSDRYALAFDSIWVNLYRDGRDSVAWHGDRNARVLTNPLVATVSLGARRRFLLRPKGSTEIGCRLEPGPGDLIVMGGACQHEWEHTVPKQAKASGPRIAITVRHSR